MRAANSKALAAILGRRRNRKGYALAVERSAFKVLEIMISKAFQDVWDKVGHEKTTEGMIASLIPLIGSYNTSSELDSDGQKKAKQVSLFLQKLDNNLPEDEKNIVNNQIEK